MTTGLTVLVPTYKRHSNLSRLLEGFAALDMGELDVEFAIVDNECSDAARDIVEAWADRLPVRYLREEVAGKNRALNRALAEVDLREIVVFTDDDIDPDPGWLRAVSATCERWPDHNVFGGCVRVVWPDAAVPAWARDRYVMEFAFSHHEYDENERPYDSWHFPFGPNFWVRSTVLEGGRRFDVGIGPHPTNRSLGDETLFLVELCADGHPPVYAPHAVVGHCIEPGVMNGRWVLNRAAQLGRGLPHVYGLPRSDLLRSKPFVWRCIRRLSVLRYAMLSALSLLKPSRTRRITAAVHPLRELASDREALRIAARRRSEQDRNSG